MPIVTFFYLLAAQFVCLLAFLTSASATRLYRGRVQRLTSYILRAATHETGGETMTYTDTDSNSRELAATAGIKLIKVDLVS